MLIVFALVESKKINFVVVANFVVKKTDQLRQKDVQFAVIVVLSFAKH